tara:strand:- start:131 stop:313 length:183 start_codon:yes stop_codon:yes gene_type:complete
MKQFDANLTHLGVFFVRNALNIGVFAAYQGSSTIFSYFTVPISYSSIMFIVFFVIVVIII